MCACRKFQSHRAHLLEGLQRSLAHGLGLLPLHLDEARDVAARPEQYALAALAIPPRPACLLVVPLRAGDPGIGLWES